MPIRKQSCNVDWIFSNRWKKKNTNENNPTATSPILEGTSHEHDHQTLAPVSAACRHTSAAHCGINPTLQRIQARHRQEYRTEPAHRPEPAYLSRCRRASPAQTECTCHTSLSKEPLNRKNASPRATNSPNSRAEYPRAADAHATTARPRQPSCCHQTRTPPSPPAQAASPTNTPSHPPSTSARHDTAQPPARQARPPAVAHIPDLA